MAITAHTTIQLIGRAIASILGWSIVVLVAYAAFSFVGLVLTVVPITGLLFMRAYRWWTEICATRRQRGSVERLDSRQSQFDEREKRLRELIGNQRRDSDEREC
jgi:hypothetical protein